MNREYHVTVYALYPIHEPAEGGYYYEGVSAKKTYGPFDRLKDAREKLREVADQELCDYRQGLNQYVDWSYLDKYIGSGTYVAIEHKPASQEKGRVPYE